MSNSNFNSNSNPPISQYRPRRRVPSPASTYPPEFMMLFQRVLETNAPVRINNLDNRRAAYTSIRARLHAWRKTLHEEAEASGDERRIDIAERLYAVAVAEPRQEENGRWYVDIRPKDSKSGNAIAEILNKNSTPTPTPKSPTRPTTPTPAQQEYSPTVGTTSGADAISAEYNRSPQDSE